MRHILMEVFREINLTHEVALLASPEKDEIHTNLICTLLVDGGSFIS